MSRWCVADMDRGLLIVRDTRRECVEWAREETMLPRVAARYAYGGGAYEYTLRAGSDPDDTDSVWIGRFPDALAAHGWDPDQEPMFPDPQHPHEARGDRP